MAALSPTAMPDRDTLRALAQAAARREAPSRSCIVSVSAHTRVRDGKQQSVSAYTRSNPDCAEGNDGPWIAVQDRGSVPPGYGQRLPGPQDPVGRLRSPIEIDRGTNPPADIRGRPYSGHALDRMQGRGLSPSTVENAVRPENLIRSSRGANLYWDPVNRIMVVVDPRTNTVITAIPRSTAPRR